jgi:hypothetical protein
LACTRNLERKLSYFRRSWRDHDDRRRSRQDTVPVLRQYGLNHDLGQTSFGAFLTSDDLEIIRADVSSRVTIASTAGAFDAFGFDTQVNNSGEVAFTGRLDGGDRGLFSGTGGAVTTHYTDSAPVLVDGVTADLSGGNFGRPAINNTAGELAFFDFVEPDLNDLGIGAFETSFVDAAGQFVTALVTSDDDVLSTVADTLHGYGAFGFYSPSINARRQVAFEGLLANFTTDGVFTGPNPKKDAIITSADRLDGARIISTSINMCAEGLNNSGEVVFTVDIVDNTVLEGFRSAIYLATPKRPLR